MSLYGTFTIEDSNAIGKKFKAVCKHNYNYEKALTEDKEYIITIVEGILPVSPLCGFLSDNGENGVCHLTRFDKIGEVE